MHIILGIWTLPRACVRAFSWILLYRCLLATSYSPDTTQRAHRTFSCAYEPYLGRACGYSSEPCCTAYTRAPTRPSPWCSPQTPLHMESRVPFGSCDRWVKYRQGIAIPVLERSFRKFVPVLGCIFKQFIPVLGPNFKIQPVLRTSKSRLVWAKSQNPYRYCDGTLQNV